MLKVFYIRPNREQYPSDVVFWVASLLGSSRSSASSAIESFGTTIIYLTYKIAGFSKKEVCIFAYCHQ